MRLSQLCQLSPFQEDAALSITPPVAVTQRVVSWGRSRDGSEFARGNRSVDTEGFCKSQMTLNSGLRWLRVTLRCLRWNGRNSVPGCPRGHPEATLRPCGSQPVGTPRLPRGYPEATLRLPGRSGAGWEESGAGGPPSSGNSTNQSAKARAITTNSNRSPVHESLPS